MNVRDLIARLQEMPPDALVAFPKDGGYLVTAARASATGLVVWLNTTPVPASWAERTEHA